MTDRETDDGKSRQAFRTISEAAGRLGLPQHVLRFWESKFPQLRPMKRAGGRRYYRPEDLALLERIRHLLHDEGYTIKGVQKLLREGTAGDAVLPVDSAPATPEMEAPVPETMPVLDSNPGGLSADSNPGGLSADSNPGGLSAETRAEIESVLGELRSIRALIKASAA